MENVQLRGCSRIFLLMIKMKIRMRALVDEGRKQLSHFPVFFSEVGCGGSDAGGKIVIDWCVLKGV